MTLSHDPGQVAVAAFRTELKPYGVSITLAQAREVLRKIGDRGVAFDAMLLSPRPKWLEELAGPIK